jgi:hypothetical protein
MKQHQTSWVQKVLFLAMVILGILSSVTRVGPVLAQSTPVSFDAVDEYISTKMKELGIPGAALVIVEGNKIVLLELLMLPAARSHHRHRSSPGRLESLSPHWPSCNWWKQAKLSWMSRFKRTCPGFVLRMLMRPRRSPSASF